MLRWSLAEYGMTNGGHFIHNSPPAVHYGDCLFQSHVYCMHCFVKINNLHTLQFYLCWKKNYYSQYYYQCQPCTKPSVEAILCGLVSCKFSILQVCLKFGERILVAMVVFLSGWESTKLQLLLFVEWIYFQDISCQKDRKRDKRQNRRNVLVKRNTETQNKEQMRWLIASRLEQMWLPLANFAQTWQGWEKWSNNQRIQTAVQIGICLWQRYS